MTDMTGVPDMSGVAGVAGLHALTERVRGLWAGLASAPVAFGPAGTVSVVASPASLLCPPGWLGLVAVGGAGLVTAPDEEAARAVREAGERGLGVADLADADAVRRALPLRTGAVLGPAALAYVSKGMFRPEAAGPQPVEALGAAAGEAAGATDGTAEGGARGDADSAAGSEAGGPPGLRELWAECGADEIDESGLREITSPAFVVRDDGDGRVTAAAGYRLWPGATAHVCVLTAPRARDRGLARTVGAAAVAHALDSGLLPQWRARVAASRRVAAALGFRELGTQLSVEVVRGGQRGRAGRKTGRKSPAPR